MKNVIEFYVQGNDPILGVVQNNIVPVLNENNWKQKAVIQQDSDSLFYIYISKLSYLNEAKPYYSLNYYEINNDQLVSQEIFTSPEAALMHLYNGN